MTKVLYTRSPRRSHTNLFPGWIYLQQTHSSRICLEKLLFLAQNVKKIFNGQVKGYTRMPQMNSLKLCKRIGLVKFAYVRLYRCDCRFRITLWECFNAS